MRLIQGKIEDEKTMFIWPLPGRVDAGRKQKWALGLDDILLQFFAMKCIFRLRAELAERIVGSNQYGVIGIIFFEELAGFFRNRIDSQENVGSRSNPIERPAVGY